MADTILLDSQGNPTSSQQEPNGERIADQQELNEERIADLRITRDINDELRKQLNLIKDQKDFKNATRKILRDLSNLAEQNVDFAEEERNFLLDKENIAKRQQKLEHTRTRLRTEQQTLIQEINVLEQVGHQETIKEKKERERSLEIARDTLEMMKDQLENSDNMVNSLELASEASDKISNMASPKFFSVLSDFMTKMPGLSKLSGPFEKAAKAAKETAAEMHKSNLSNPAQKSGKFAIGMKSFAAGFKELLGTIKNISVPLLLLAGLIKFVKNLFAMDEKITKLGKTFGMSKDRAQVFRTSLTEMSKDMGPFIRETDDVQEAMLALNEMDGFTTVAAKENVKLWSRLTKLYKISEESAMGIHKLTILNNDSAKVYEDSIFNVVKEEFKSSKMKVDAKKLMVGMSKVSGQILLNQKGSNVELAKSLITTKKLGISLDDARNISNSLLDFESSIEAEMKAELLTGKQLNLERARSLALQGKFAESAKSALANVGGIYGFQKLNVIQQEAMAKAMGMNVDQLSDALISQRLLNHEQQRQVERFRKMGMDEEARKYTMGKLNDEALKAAKSELSEKEKLSKMINTISAAFEEIFGNNKFQGWLRSATEMVGKITDLVKNLENSWLFGNKTTMDVVLESLFGEEGAKDLSSGAMANPTSYVGEFGGAGGSWGETTEDFIIRPGQPVQKFRKDDVIVGGTNLDGGKGDNKTNQLLENILGAVENGGDVYIDGNKAGRSLVLAASKMG